MEIKKTIEDRINFPRNRSSIGLTPDKPISPYHISYPVTWTGFVNNEKVIIVQKDDMSSSIDNYEFLEFPSQYNYLKSEVVEAIDDYLKIMD